jgi:geranylgeranyl pyrophosphate synthase
MNPDFIKNYQVRVNNALEKILPAETQLSQRLHQAMRYSVLNGGKRIRPALVYATGEIFNAKPELLDAAACSVELIHSYSLVHDDLPAMDDDVLRRGKPTCHIAFDEATAILAGDALQSLAFQCLAKTNLKMVNTLAIAVGSAGMVGGQEIDMMNTGKNVDLAELKQMHRLKTGALIIASVRMGVESAENVSEKQMYALMTYAEHLGLAFQVKDDILDIESSTADLGKTQGKDVEQHKNTYPGLLGLENAKRYAIELYEQAIKALEIFDERADHLRELVKYAVYRSS